MIVKTQKIYIMKVPVTTAKEDTCGEEAPLHNRKTSARSVLASFYIIQPHNAIAWKVNS